MDCQLYRKGVRFLIEKFAPATQTTTIARGKDLQAALGVVIHPNEYISPRQEEMFV
jgi:hypothetical protein